MAVTGSSKIIFFGRKFVLLSYKRPYATRYKMKISLIISTYNWPRALELCLDSVMELRELPDEILIADDGSGEETRCVVEHFQRISPVPIYHIWQPDDGFRLAAIRNKAIAASHYEYIIQIDGDVLLHRDFVRDHKRYAREDYFTAGARGRIMPELVPTVLNRESFRPSILTKGMASRFNMLHIPFIARLYCLYGPKRHVKGCNMSFWRKDLLQINGYDENFVGWGGEDDDLAARLINSEIQQQSLKFAAIVYHIAHGQHDRENRTENKERFLRSRQNGAQRCSVGLDRHIIHS